MLYICYYLIVVMVVVVLLIVYFSIFYRFWVYGISIIVTKMVGLKCIPLTFIKREVQFCWMQTIFLLAFLKASLKLKIISIYIFNSHYFIINNSFFNIWKKIAQSKYLDKYYLLNIYFEHSMNSVCLQNNKKSIYKQ